MTELDAYLARYFDTAPRFAARCGLSSAKLQEWVDARLIPAPSYVVGQGTITSAVFGTLPALGSQAGEYFRRDNEVWVTIAKTTIASVGRAAAHAALRTRFACNMKTALATLNATWRLRDSYADDGSELGGLEDRIEGMWADFLDGTYGLCVADPRSEAAIARKEILQQQLSELSNGGTHVGADESARTELLPLIDAYAQAAMPFSPVDYPLSSRKRLVADLLALINHAQCGSLR